MIYNNPNAGQLGGGPPQLNVPPSTLAGGGGALSPLAAALMQGAMPNQTGAPPTATGGQLLQTGGAVPGAVPIGAPTNQFGNVPAPSLGAPVPQRPLSVPVAAGMSAPVARPIGVPVAAAPIGVAPRPFGFGGLRPQQQPPQGY